MCQLPELQTLRIQITTITKNVLRASYLQREKRKKENNIRNMRITTYCGERYNNDEKWVAREMKFLNVHSQKLEKYLSISHQASERMTAAEKNAFEIFRLRCLRRAAAFAIPFRLSCGEKIVCRNTAPGVIMCEHKSMYRTAESQRTTLANQKSVHNRKYFLFIDWSK